ncbi:MAG: glycoside hydrolase family 130 protein, partial [Planctomycetota bacterium]
ERARHLVDASGASQETADIMLSLARSNYHLEMPADALVSEVVIFPSSENESNGIEDVRLVLFTDDDGSQTYYGTYTAYNGFRIFPQLLEISDFRTVKIHTLSGRNAQNKGMALFPRKVDGWYMMVSRLDNENLYLMRSDNVRFWNDAEVLQTPKFPWEIVQIGNCGSPLETPDGWLLLTHGVGPMRQYCMGATLLDLDNPSKIIGQTSQPLLVPIEDERDGYVPNVVYSCGAMIHHDQLVIPYAMSDFATGFATIPMDELLTHLKS